MAWTRTNRPLRVVAALLVCAVFVSVCYYASVNNVNVRRPLIETTPPVGRSGKGPHEIQTFHLEDMSIQNDSIHLVGQKVTIGGRPGDGESSRLLELTLEMDLKSIRTLKSLVKLAESRAFPWKPIKVKDVDCSKVFANDEAEMQRALELQKAPPQAVVTDDNIIKLASTCSSFVKEYGFITSELTEEEKNFPIAFSIVTFKDAEQVVNLLRTIYRPQNTYCVHVDKKSNDSFSKALSAVASCLPNVFMASRSIDVQWGQFSLLEPELVCMRDLWNYTRWKYFINLTGQEFPLKTNYELVKILTAYNGANDMEGTVKRANVDRWTGGGLPPHGLRPVKGSVHVTANRKFVDYVLHSKVAQDFLDWCKRVSVPDETFFATLNHSPQLGILGTYKGEPETHPVDKPFLTRFKNWGVYPFDYPCAGEVRVRMICILSVGDLPFLDKRRELFANKFYSDYSRVALGCMAERIYNRTRDEYLGNLNFDTSYYQNVSFVNNMVNSADDQ